MKLHKRGAETVKSEDGSIEIVVKPITKGMQVEVVDLYANFNTAKDKDAFVDHILKNCVESLTIGGEAFDPNEVAELADMSDFETAEQLYSISTLVMSAMFKVGDEKKSD
jgi:phosphoribosylformimino-5-aminoimidazole carboxamide ribonucleotide (ProFAR) isomerase